ncbi:hybrid sensor histidine kinase/response regulator transcription factor [Larkinella punicea]|uniref:hybrid sensor histidine kinase/response regulator transcription factor n=1 Tax=Larkinella punicea TaxID=2315727 RepID=UPI001401CEA6|nr:ATP-binding protein [Larkinella punicea]
MGLWPGLVAQPTALPPAEVLTERQGLPQAFVSSIIQDQKGFIWMATRDGLCRYDGQRFRVFQPASGAKTSISFPDVYRLKSDPQGNLWIKSEHDNLDRFDPNLETFQNITHQPFYQRHFGRDTLYDVCPGTANRVWFLFRNNGLVGWNYRTNRFRWYKHTDRPESLSNNELRDAVEDHSGNLWITSDSGLDRLDERTGHFIHYRHQPGNPASMPDRVLGRMHVRKNGDLLVHSRRHLTLMHTKTGGVTVFPLPPLGDFLWWEASFTSDSRGNDYLLWFNQVFRFNEQTGLQHLPALTAGITAKSFFIDRSDVLWIGTNGSGVRKYDLSENGFERYPYRTNFYTDLLRDQLGVSQADLPPFPASTDPYHFRYALDKKGILWFNLGGPIYQLDLKTKRIKPVSSPAWTPSKERRGQDVNYLSLACDPAGQIWVVSANQLAGYDQSRQRWQVFPYRFSLPSTIQQLVVDERAFWLATEADGLYRVDRVTGQIRRYAHQPQKTASLSSNALFCLSADPLDKNTLWIGTFGSGLCRFDKRTGQCRRFAMTHGLPNNVVYSAIPDRSGNVWIGTNKGVFRLNRHSFLGQSYTSQDGILADEFNRFHFLQLPNGRIMMGGLEGITAFYPDQIKNDTYQPSVELTGIQVNNRNVKPGVGSPVGEQPEQAVSSLTLPHHQNFLNLEFAALQYNKSTKNRYRYRLTGLDDDWITSERPVAVYTDVQPGHYRFLVNASNTSGVWSRYVRQLGITIRPPWWATWWAYTLYGLLVLGLFAVFLRAYRNRLQLRQSIELKQREVELKQKEAEQLKAVDEMKTRFFANITHEFRTPLTLILSPVDGLIQDLHGTKYAHRLSSVSRNAHQLLRLINQLMDLSKLDANAMTVEERVGNPGEWVGQVVETFQEAADQKAIRLTVCGITDHQYWFDSSLLERIVYNLVANALKFTPEGGQIAVAIQEPAPGQSEWVVRISDTGIGIPKEQLPVIFDRFYQVDPSSTRQHEGTGIGLALVKELVQLQRGRISMESELGKGTTVTVQLPYGRADRGQISRDRDDDWRPPFPAIPTPEVVSRVALDLAREEPDEGVMEERTTVLIVEDNDELADLITTSLPTAYRIHRARNGAEGLKLAIDRMPELIISDVLMPVMDGFTFCRQIRENHATSHIPVILLTAKSSTENRLEGLSLGADDYLTKPFLVSELQLRVRNRLEQRQKIRDWVRASLLSPSTLMTLPVAETIDPFLEKLYTLLENALDDSTFGVDELALVAGFSRTNLYRKIKALTGLPTKEFIRNYRLKRATHFLRKGHPVSETATLVGFENHSYFTRCFRELYQVTPSEFVEADT